MAILMGEPESAAFATLLLSSTAVIGAPTLVECGRVAIGRFAAEGLQQLDTLLNDARIAVVPFDEAHASTAVEALKTFGRGTGHRANLNFGDCMAYAVAKRLNAPLLFKGDDFIHTDIVPALPQAAP